MDQKDLRALLTLQAVAHSGGYASAARELGTTRAAISRIIAEAEQRCGIRLTVRTTRKVVLTENAQAMLREVGSHLDAMQAAWSALPEQEGALRGRIRISASHAFGREYVLPSLVSFRRANPGIQFDIRLNDAIEDIVARQIDIAIRLGPLAPSSLIARKIGRCPTMLVASPSLIAGRRRKPRTVEELNGLPVVVFRAPNNGPRMPWTIGTDEGLVVHEFDAPNVEIDSLEGVFDLIRGGVGIGLLPCFLCENEVRAGRLVSLLDHLEFVGPEVNICFAQRDLLPHRVRSLIDTLVTDIGDAMRRAQ